MFLIDTNVLSERRKRTRCNAGVRAFMDELSVGEREVFVSAVTIGELRYGVENARRRGDDPQAAHLERWLMDLVHAYEGCILPVDLEIAQVWGKLRARSPHNEIDKLIAATALLYNLTVVTRNDRDYADTGAKVLNPFRAA